MGYYKREPEQTKAFSSWLRKIAPTKGFNSQRQLAKASKLNEATISRIWNAIQFPDVITLTKIAQALGVDVKEAMLQAGYPVELVPITTEPPDPNAIYMNDPIADDIMDNIKLMSREDKETIRRLTQSIVNRKTEGVS